MLVLPGYQQLVQIGEGGLGRVYRAVRESTGGTVAIKELRDVKEASPAWHRAVREVDAMLRLKGHPYVVSVEEIVSGPDGPCIVMEYMSGGSLFDRLQRGALSTPEVLLVGHHVALALAAAHNVGVIHRDVKPHNILVGGFGQVKIGDFGIAAVVRESGQRTQTQALTLAYASPEELDGEEEVGVATDVYSLAATLGHLATGRKPSFRERQPLSLPMDSVPALRAVGDALRAGMEIDPAMRPTMQQLADIFDRAATTLGAGKLASLAPLAGLDPDATVVGAGAVRTPVPVADTVPRRAAPVAAQVAPAPPPPPPPPPAMLVPPPPAPLPAAPPRRRRGALIAAAVAMVGLLVGGIVAFAIGRGDDTTGRSAPSSTAASSPGNTATEDVAVATSAAPAAITTPVTAAPTSAPATTSPATAPPVTAAPATAPPVTAPPVTAPPATATPALRVISLHCNYCRLRSQANTSSSIVAELSGLDGATVEVLDEGGAGWLYVRVNGTQGWIFGTFVWPVPSGFQLGEQTTAIALLTSSGAPSGVDNPTGNKVLITSTSGSLYQVLLPDGSTAYVSASTPISR